MSPPVIDVAGAPARPSPAAVAALADPGGACLRLLRRRGAADLAPMLGLPAATETARPRGGAAAAASTRLRQVDQPQAEANRRRPARGGAGRARQPAAPAEATTAETAPPAPWRPSPAAATVIEQTAARFGLAAGDVRGRRRDAAHVHARQVAMHLCREVAGLSLSEIGREFDGRHHATVLHADRKTRALLAAGGPASGQVAALAAQLRPATPPADTPQAGPPAAPAGVGGLAEAQARMRAWSARTGCGRDPLRQMLCLAEEVGEVACEIRRLEGFSRRADDGAALPALAAELADVVITAATAANIYGIDLAAAVSRKVAVVAARPPLAAPARGEGP